MVEMLPDTPVPMPPRRDVEVTLHLIHIHTPKKPTAIRLPLHLWRLPPLRPLLPRRHNIMHMLLPEPPLLLEPPLVPRPSLHPPLLVPPQLMRPLPIRPLAPHRVLLLQQHPREDEVPRRVLHVDVQVPAPHAHHHVQVDLHVLAHALLDRERVVLGPAPPPRQLAPH